MLKLNETRAVVFASQPRRKWEKHVALSRLGEVMWGGVGWSGVEWLLLL